MALRIASVRRDMRGQAVFIRDDYGHSSVRHVLLVLDVLVGSYQDLVTRFFRSVQQLSVGQGTPALLLASSTSWPKSCRRNCLGVPLSNRIRMDDLGPESCATCSSAAFTSDSSTPPNHSMKS